MGIRYVKAANAAARATGLTHAPTRLLMGMASVVLDRPGNRGEPSGRYFAGRIAQAMSLGYGFPDPNEADSKAAHRSVDDAMKAIRAAGLILTVRGAVNHRRADYDLSPVLAYEGMPGLGHDNGAPVDNA